MEILIHQRPQIVSGDYSMNFNPFGACDGSLESSNPTLFNHMGLSHFNTSYSIRSCSFLSKIFLLILTGSIASKGIGYVASTKSAWLAFYSRPRLDRSTDLAGSGRGPASPSDQTIPSFPYSTVSGLPCLS